MTMTARGAALPAATPLPAFLQQASVEVTAKDATRLRSEAPAFAPSAVFLPWLPGEHFEARLAATVSLTDQGFDCVPHLSARRLTSVDELTTQLERLTREAGVTRLLLIGGDPAEPLGPFADSAAVIRAADFAGHGIRTVGIAGHPEGHPNMSATETVEVLHEKLDLLRAQGVRAEIVTQFSFDADLVAEWIAGLRLVGIDAPVAVGVPGPAKVTTLMKFAARCGVGASAKAVAKYGFSVTRLFGNAGPDSFVTRLIDCIAETPDVRAHFYPFGGFADTAAWLEGQKR